MDKGKCDHCGTISKIVYVGKEHLCSSCYRDYEAIKEGREAYRRALNSWRNKGEK